MPIDNRQPIEQRLREAASNVEQDVKRLISYFNDEVVPDVRRNGSAALRLAAAEIDRLARRMEEAGRTPPPPPKPEP